MPNCGALSAVTIAGASKRNRNTPAGSERKSSKPPAFASASATYLIKVNTPCTSKPSPSSGSCFMVSMVLELREKGAAKGPSRDV
jgi:hypothetical protein